MLTRKLGALSAVLFMGTATIGCGDDTGDTGGTGGTEGTGGTMGTGGTDVTYVANDNCPDPSTANFQHGACCMRGEPNSERVKNAPDGTVDIGYRMNWNFTKNQPATLSVSFLRDSAQSRSQGEQQSMLLKFTLPVQDGKLVAGDGELSVGYGRYNCDGTYSFFGDVAPLFTSAESAFPNSDDTSRWSPTVVAFDFDPEDDTTMGFPLVWDNQPNVKSYTPFADSSSYEFDWEIIAENTHFTKWGNFSDEATLDCVGSRMEDLDDWTPGGEYMSFGRLDDNTQGDNGINLLTDQNFANLVAFGTLKNFEPLGDRCEPGSDVAADSGLADEMGKCLWQKLPDSLCPDTEEERELFRCHLGAMPADGPGAATPGPKCSADAPTDRRDENADDEGQCCDPMGDPASGLPKCNAYRLVNEIVAASAVITDTNSTEFGEWCEGNGPPPGE